MADKNETCDLERVTKFIVIGLAAGGYEGGYNNCCESSAGDYPSFGIGGWEGLNSEGDQFLQRMASKNDSLKELTSYVGKTYSELESSGDKVKIQTLFESEAGKKAQLEILGEDFPGRYWGVMNDYFPGFFSLEPRSQIYIGMWMNTGPACCAPFIEKRPHDNFETVYKVYKEEYGPAAVSSEYWKGYANRAEKTYEYVNSLDLSKDPDPSMAFDSGGPSKFGKIVNGLVAGVGFDIKVVGETVTLTKLPKGKTPAEPIYPDWITVSDTVPQWVLSTTAAAVSAKRADNDNPSSTEKKEDKILSSEEIAEAKKSALELKTEIDKIKDNSLQKWCADNELDYADKTDVNQKNIAEKYKAAAKEDAKKPEKERKFNGEYYFGEDTVLKNTLDSMATKIKTLTDLNVKIANSKKAEDDAARAKAEAQYGK